MSASGNAGPGTPNSRRVLVVDDDAGTRLLIAHHLKRAGYETILATHLAEAREVFTKELPNGLNAVISDYLMPDGTGLELLQWIKQRDPSLATVIVTAVGERTLVQESLRGGACDFLDKPIQIPTLLKAVETGIKRTEVQRRLQDAELSIKEVGRFQQFMLGANPAHLPTLIDICWHPKHAAGGDLVNVFQLEAGRMLVLVADISGHDLKAGFISAYFQGIVRGMIEKKTPIEEVFDYFNRFLLREWSGGNTFNVAASVSACAFVIDLAQKQFALWNNGFPIPVAVDAQGHTTRCGIQASYPLGWFEDSAPATFKGTFESDSFVYAWTDGLEDLAAQLNLTPLCLASRLLKAHSSGVQLPELEGCSDDVLAIRIRLSVQASGSDFQHIVCEHYYEDQDREIDQHQSQWATRLQRALPGLSAATLHDVLLCTREAVVNAIRYGCLDSGGEPCALQVSYRPQQSLLRVEVNDPGQGHDFDWAAYQTAAAEELLPAHRGLALIHGLPNATRVARNGASLTMDFLLQP